MNLPKMAVKRPVATGAILLLVLIIGLVSLYQSPLDLLPDIEAPVLAVITSFPGSSPQESLELVTKPIEESVSAVGGVTGINSYSRENLSLVVVLFDWGADVSRIREDVSTRMELVDLPDGAQRPMILEFDPTLMPIMQVSAGGGDDLAELTGWLKETAAPRLESVLGVAEVQVQGGVEQDIFVRALPESMDRYEVSFDQVAGVLQASLMDLPAGIIDLEDREVRLRFLGRYDEYDMLSDLVVGFKIDEVELERMIDRQIDIDLNRMLSEQTDRFTAGQPVGSGDMPKHELYWDDIFDFGQSRIENSSLLVPVSRELIDQAGADLQKKLRLFTVNPAVTYEADQNHLVLSLSYLGRTRLDGLIDPDPVRLEDFWLIEYAAWDGNQTIVPLDPLSLQRLRVDETDLARLAESHPLITKAQSNYVLVSFHEDWQEIRREPIISVPDLESWLSGVQDQVSRGLDDASGELEKMLVDMATSMLAGSMPREGGAFGQMAALELDDDFPVIPVTLGMIAEVVKDTHEPTTIARYNKEPGVSLLIQKEGDANTVTVARDVRAALDELAEESEGAFSRVTFNAVMDQAEEIEHALADLARTLLGGAFLAVLVLLLFLRNWRTTMFIALSIPAAIIATFTLLYFADLIINLMTLGGLSLAAGMLVDNAIVVSENIYRLYQMGEKPSDAAVKGAREVASAITASTLTTISVFFPVVFLTGLAGELFWEFALTVGCAVLASLIIALTVIPLLASRSLSRRDKKEKERAKPHRLPVYRGVLRAAVRHPWWVIIFALLFIGGGVLGFTTLGTELFPVPDESSFRIDITLPPGSSLEKTDAYVSRVEEIIDETAEVDYFSTRVGGSGFLGMGGGGPSNEARIRVEIDPQYTEEIGRIIGEVREEVEALPDEAEVNFTRESVLDAAGLETSLDIVISGDNLDKIIEITDEAAEILSEHHLFTDVQSSLEESRPEVHIRLDHSEALQKGATLAQVAGAVRSALEGQPVSRIETEEGILEIVLGYEKRDIKTIEDLGGVGFYTAGGDFVRIDEVATLEESFGPYSIPRENRRVVGELEMQYEGVDLGTASNEALAALADIDLPEGYEIRPAGSTVMMDDVLSELELVLFVAALLVYLVMAAQFESLLHPFIIISSLPLAYAGSIFALMITGSSISVPALIGLIVLSGILVNDGIIMVDYINQLRRIHGRELTEAIVEGAATRLRPIMMVTATTVLGLFPLALGIGEGAQMQAPMAITIIGGQITGTILLLLAIPSVYKVVTRDKPGGGENEPAPVFYSGEQPSGQIRGRSIIMNIVRMVIVLVLLALILALFYVSGQEPLMVIN